MIFFLIVVHSIQAQATTVLVTIGDNGIIVAADRKKTNAQSAGLGEIRKIALIQHRFAVASIGLERFVGRGSLGDTVDYDFETWIVGIERGLPNYVLFDDFVGILKHEVSILIPQLERPFRDGALRPQTPTDVLEPLIQYAIVGYQDGVPRLSILEFYADWASNRLLGPYEFEIEPTSPPFPHNRGYGYGVTQAATEFTHRNSYAYKQAMARCPKAIEKFIADTPLTLDESSSLSRVLIKVEEEISPSAVGGSAQLVWIPRSGLARDLSGEGLPKKTTGRQTHK
jgi:hypothetical protein